MGESVLLYFAGGIQNGEAIELVCGGSPIGCVLVECKAQHIVK